MKLIKPKKLKKGDTIGLLSVSGERESDEKIHNAERYINSLGYKTVVSETSYKKFRHYAGTDEERINALHEFFERDDINAIVCTRGGYGVLRLVNKIDFNFIRKYAKLFCGYSDISILLLLLYKKIGLVTLHGAMTDGDFGNNNICDYTAQSFWHALTGFENKVIKADNNPEVFLEGEAKGILWGGNLTTIASMIGIDFMPNRKFIFFFEDVNEPAYKIDRMLTQLFNYTKFRQNVAGIAVGEFTEADSMDYINQVIREYAQKYNLPCCNGFRISHNREKITIPVGLKCSFSTETKSIVLRESVFCD